MNNSKLQDFATNAVARNYITFGDVRRLQRDVLPDGVTIREDAETLIRLDAMIHRADKAWAEWLVAGIIGLAKRETPGEAVDSGFAEWMNGLAAVSTPVTRSILRKLRREARRREDGSACPAEKSETAVPSSAPCDSLPVNEPNEEPIELRRARPRGSAPKTSHKPRRSVGSRRPDRPILTLACSPAMTWPSGVCGKDLGFHLAAPCA